jgi:hypothetical protein
MFQLTVGSGFEMDDADCLAISLGVLAVAVACVAVVRRHARVAVAIVVATSGIFAYLGGTASGLQPELGVRCSFRELWAAGITWTIVTIVGRREGVTFSRSSVTAVAAAGALAAHAGQHLACEVPHSDAHLLVFHFGAVVLAALLGAASAGRRWTAAPSY